jgi:hypothetical protein
MTTICSRAIMSASESKQSGSEQKLIETQQGFLEDIVETKQTPEQDRKTLYKKLQQFLEKVHDKTDSKSHPESFVIKCVDNASDTSVELLHSLTNVFEEFDEMDFIKMEVMFNIMNNEGTRLLMKQLINAD